MNTTNHVHVAYYIYIYTHTQTCIHTYINTHIHAYIQLSFSSKKATNTDGRTRDPSKKQVEIMLVCARHLPKMDVMGTCDAYVVLRRGGTEFKSATKKNTYAPDFGERFYFDVSICVCVCVCLCVCVCVCKNLYAPDFGERF